MLPVTRTYRFRSLNHTKGARYGATSCTHVSRSSSRVRGRTAGRILLVWIAARIVGEEQVGSMPCWVVQVDAGAPWTLWIVKSRQVAPVQQIRIEQPDDKRAALGAARTTMNFVKRESR